MLEELIAGLEPDAGEENGKAEIAEELVGGDGHIPDDRADVAELRERDGGEQRTAGQTDAQGGVQAGNGQRDAADQDAQDDSEKYGDELGSVQGFGRNCPVRFRPF